jgi:hypothetical protein
MKLTTRVQRLEAQARPRCPQCGMPLSCGSCAPSGPRAYASLTDEERATRIAELFERVRQRREQDTEQRG